MRYLLNRTQMQEADAYTIEKIGIPSLVLMERAALQCVAVMEKKIDLSKTLIVCGSGNNGGDGFAIARLLVEKGYHPTVVFVGKESSLSKEAECQYDILKNLHVDISQTLEESGYTCIVDAIFGVGLNRSITGHYCSLIEQLNKMSGVKVAIDLPSGVDASNGKILGCAFQANLTISMAYEKLGTILYPGKEYSGEVMTVSIGIVDEYVIENGTCCFTFEKKDLESLLPRRAAYTHKGSYGKVLMIVGSPGMSGAAFLSAKAAYVTGAGLVQIYTHEKNLAVLQTLLPEAIVSTYSSYDEMQLRKLLSWADVVAIGSGLGTQKDAEKILEYTLEQFDRSCVIDADGINLLSEHISWLDNTKASVVLTPHIKEMSRLTKESVARILENRREILLTFEEKHDIVCVLKDARTVVASNNSAWYVNTSGCAAMAKAGSGDVLTGVITALIAQGKQPFEASCLGVYLHGLSGECASEHKGKYSVLARDLIEQIEGCMEEYKEM